ncbi:hypothetical protein PISL3812_09135 [Talaromyces islandicus]|uniref:C2H2-type domain-containing protein n=1 Tax=Talaromyces islandicus TaxID=28573 RepID=A0A0U1MAT2_TALIS|nr:hypothetical protein PISL3812_09135 [Talaromyces islandicus]
MSSDSNSLQHLYDGIISIVSDILRSDIWAAEDAEVSSASRLDNILLKLKMWAMDIREKDNTLGILDVQADRAATAIRFYLNEVKTILITIGEAISKRSLSTHLRYSEDWLIKRAFYSDYNRLKELLDQLEAAVDGLQTRVVPLLSLADISNDFGRFPRLRVAMREYEEAGLKQRSQIKSILGMFTDDDGRGLTESSSKLEDILISGYHRTGDTDVLETVITMTGSRALAMSPDNPDWPSTLDRLGTLLFCRYNHRGVADDLQSAIRVAEMAVGSSPVNRQQKLDNLGIMLERKYQGIERHWMQRNLQFILPELREHPKAAFSLKAGQVNQATFLHPVSRSQQMGGSQWEGSITNDSEGSKLAYSTSEFGIPGDPIQLENSGLPHSQNTHQEAADQLNADLVQVPQEPIAVTIEYVVRGLRNQLSRNADTGSDTRFLLEFLDTQEQYILDHTLSSESARHHPAYRCMLCEMTSNFSIREAFMRHSNKSYAAKYYRCYLCSSAYSSKDALRHHLMDVHIKI